MKTTDGIYVPGKLNANYLTKLVDQFFKILPLYEEQEPSLKEFMKSLRVELLGQYELMKYLHYDPMYMTLLSILQYLIDNECDASTVKREVFKAIKICKNLRQKYFGQEVR